MWYDPSASELDTSSVLFISAGYGLGNTGCRMGVASLYHELTCPPSPGCRMVIASMFIAHTPFIKAFFRFSYIIALVFWSRSMTTLAWSRFDLKSSISLLNWAAIVCISFFSLSWKSSSFFFTFHLRYHDSQALKTTFFNLFYLWRCLIASKLPDFFLNATLAFKAWKHLSCNTHNLCFVLLVPVIRLSISLLTDISSFFLVSSSICSFKLSISFCFAVNRALYF